MKVLVGAASVTWRVWSSIDLDPRHLVGLAGGERLGAFDGEEVAGAPGLGGQRVGVEGADHPVGDVGGRDRARLEVGPGEHGALPRW